MKSIMGAIAYVSTEKKGSQPERNKQQQQQYQKCQVKELAFYVLCECVS